MLLTKLMVQAGVAVAMLATTVGIMPTQGPIAIASASAAEYRYRPVRQSGQ